MIPETATVTGNISGVGKHGLLDLFIAERNNNTSYISRQNTRVPLGISKALYLDHSGRLYVYIMNPTGGMTTGDHYDQNISLDERAAAFITTQSANKIYRTDAGTASSYEKFELRPGSCLEYWPDPVIPFAGSAFIGETEIWLERDAVFIGSECLYPGRLARQEVFAYNRYRKKTRIYHEGKLVLHDLLNLEPDRMNIKAVGMMESCSYYAQIIATGPQVDRELTDKLHSVFSGSEKMLGSASLFYDHGLMVRILAENSPDLARASRECYSILRKKLLGQAIELRKY